MESIVDSAFTIVNVCKRVAAFSFSFGGAFRAFASVTDPRSPVRLRPAGHRLLSAELSHPGRGVRHRCGARAAVAGDLLHRYGLRAAALRSAGRSLWQARAVAVRRRSVRAQLPGLRPGLEPGR